MAHFSPALIARGLATLHANPDIRIDSKSPNLFPSKIEHTCRHDVRGGNIWIFFFFFFLSRSSKTHSLQKTNSSHLQHANWNICWCVCVCACVQFTKSAHIHVRERVGGDGGCYTRPGMCSCDSVPCWGRAEPIRPRAEWKGNIEELSHRKLMHMHLLQDKKIAAAVTYLSVLSTCKKGCYSTLQIFKSMWMHWPAESVALHRTVLPGSPVICIHRRSKFTLTA